MEDKYTSLHLFMHHLQLQDDAWQTMKKRLQEKHYSKKELLVKEGKVSKELFYIISGSVRYYITLDGVEMTTFFSFDKQWAGAYTAFTSRGLSQVSVEAMEDCEVLTLGFEDLQFLYQHYPSAERFGRLMAEYLVGCLEERMMSLLLKTPLERYLKTMQTNPLYFERVPQHYIASYLGVAPESLSRIRKRLTKQQVVS